MEILALILLGFAVGTFGTLVGIGGGIILVPLFLLVMDYTPQHAIATSLTIVFLNALSGTIAYVRQQKVFYDAGIRFSLATLPGALIGSYLTVYFTSKFFNVAFGATLAVLSGLMLYRTLSRKLEEQPFDKDTFTYNKGLGISLSLLVGFLSSILGIGGGVIHVPMLVYWLRFPTHVATATSHFVLAISAFFGTMSQLLLGNILLVPALSIGFGAVIGAQVGAQLSRKVQSRPILIMLALALGALGVRLILT